MDLLLIKFLYIYNTEVASYVKYVSWNSTYKGQEERELEVEKVDL